MNVCLSCAGTFGQHELNCISIKPLPVLTIQYTSGLSLNECSWCEGLIRPGVWNQHYNRHVAEQATIRRLNSLVAPIEPHVVALQAQVAALLTQVKKLESLVPAVEVSKDHLLVFRLSPNMDAAGSREMRDEILSAYPQFNIVMVDADTELIVKEPPAQKHSEVKRRPRPKKTDKPNTTNIVNGSCNDEFSCKGQTYRCTKPENHGDQHVWNFNNNVLVSEDPVAWKKELDPLSRTRLCLAKHPSRDTHCDLLYGHDSPEHLHTYSNPVERVRWDDVGNSRIEEPFVTRGNWQTRPSSVEGSVPPPFAAQLVPVERIGGMLRHPRDFAEEVEKRDGMVRRIRAAWDAEFNNIPLAENDGR